MKQRYFRFLIFFVAALVVGMFLVPQVHAAINTGIEFAAQTGLSGQDVRVTIARIIRIILGFLGVIAVGLILYAGFIWMTSKGNEEKLEQAKLILRNATVGLVIVLASFGIATFILNNLLGATGGGNGNNGNGNNNGGGIGTLGNGIIKSVYPAPFQKGVPRNTSIIVSFREPILASSICDAVTNDSPAKCASGAKVKKSVRLFKNSDGDNPLKNVASIAASSLDNKTFVFKPTSPIGSPSEVLNYTTKLTTDIKKADGSNAFKLGDFYWTFEVSSALDFIPPKIKSLTEGGVFPLPDDEVDVISGTQEATQATGTIEVKGTLSTYQAAKAVLERTSAPLTPIKANVTGTNHCVDGYINISINPSRSSATVGYYNEANQLMTGITPNPNTGVGIINSQIILGPCGLTLNLDSDFGSGNSWRINVLSEKISDDLQIGSKFYSFVSSANPGTDEIRVGTDYGATAQNIADKINIIHPEVTATVDDKAKVTVKAKVAGVTGNSIEMSTSNPVSLGLSGMSGGTDKTTTYTIKDKADQPKNTIIQINFDEGINPLMVSGTSEEVKDKIKIVNAKTDARPAGQACTQDENCLSYKCTSSVCEGNQLAGSFMISNQYKTVEFISNIKCGVNGCGENIYCLPANSNLKVEIKAASLQPCPPDCTYSPYTTCDQGVCKETEHNKNFPTAPNLNGIVDLADNSLDGNRNDNAQGQADFYNENKPKDNPGRGDNYNMSFWVSDRLDLTPPTISTLSVSDKQSNILLNKVIEITFSKLMMSSTMSTGTVTVNNGIKDVVHRLINLWSMANDPVGYWVHKEDIDVSSPPDGQFDRTVASLDHGLFNDSTIYQSQVGSGVKDIYQNCYKPSSGPGCTANGSNPSCCRNGVNGNLIPGPYADQNGVCTPEENQGE